MNANMVMIFKNLLRRACLSVLCGVLAGIAASFFLWALWFVTDVRTAHPMIIWALPLAGLFIGWLYHHYGHDLSAGSSLILDEIHQPKNSLPLKMAPYIFLTTVLTHFFGGSAGREGTAVQMGGALADQVARWFRVSIVERKALLMAGLGAGFGAAIGTPIAGFIFGMEVVRGKNRMFPWFESLLAAGSAYATALLLRAPHSHFSQVVIPALDFVSLIWVAVAACVFGLAARIFMEGTHWVERGFCRVLRYPPLRPALGGLLLLAFFWLEGSDRYAGLGIPVIQAVLVEPGRVWDPLLKAVFTAFTLGSGFKGGEFIPLVFIGSTLGSALGLWIPLPAVFLASLGFASVFAGAAGAPIACAVMAVEIFGVALAPYALAACLISALFKGSRTIYKRSAST